MDINDERLGPLCGTGEETWLAYNTGPWDGNASMARCVFYIDNEFRVRYTRGDYGYLDATKLYLPLEYCL